MRRLAIKADEQAEKLKKMSKEELLERAVQKKLVSRTDGESMNEEELINLMIVAGSGELDEAELERLAAAPAERLAAAQAERVAGEEQDEDEDEWRSIFCN